MPCRDYDYSPNHSGYEEAANHRKRCDELAAQLCSSRQVLHKLLEYSTARLVKKLPSDLAEDIASEIVGLKAHRENDKTHAILELSHAVSKLENDAKKIKKLGGIPKSNLVKKIKALKTKRDLMKTSDSLNTDLY